MLDDIKKTGQAVYVALCSDLTKDYEPYQGAFGEDAPQEVAVPPPWAKAVDLQWRGRRRPNVNARVVVLRPADRPRAQRQVRQGVVVAVLSYLLGLDMIYKHIFNIIPSVSVKCKNFPH